VGPIAQSVEQRTFNPWVDGSSPSGPTSYRKGFAVLKFPILLVPPGTPLIRCFRILSKQDRTKLIYVICLQFLFAILDFVGIACIGMLGALSIRGIQSQNISGGKVNAVLNFLHLQNSSLGLQVAILGTIATFVLASKTLLTVFFSRKTFRFISRRGALLTSDLIKKLLAQPLSAINSKSIQSTIYSLTTGVTAISLGIVATTVTLISEGILLIVMVLGLFILDPLLSVFTFVTFSILGYLVYAQMSTRARRLGLDTAKLSISSDEKVSEIILTYREATVRNRLPYYADNIKKIRLEMADGLAELQFMPNVSKYIVEFAIVLIGLILCAIQFSLYDASKAIATLALFLAAGTRIAPALMRIQQGAIQMRSNLGMAEPTLDLIEKYNQIEVLEFTISSLNRQFEGFTPSVIVEDLNYTYEGSTLPTLKNVTFKILPGESLAIIGPSGSGKSTLVDNIIGILEPTSGLIEISSLDPRKIPGLWPGVIGYVPQSVSIIEGTVRENISLGFPYVLGEEEYIDNCTKFAQLDELLETLPLGVNSQVGDRGTRLSGGEKQRLGIARALFTSPQLLVLDEATSALDGKTEELITKSLQTLQGKITMIVIAHRLSTVRNVDKVLYLNSGEVKAFGTIEEVRLLVPEFDKQAKLMGL
jgi:ABC-type multidrug transport system fused ATPase/permease subunit